MRADVMYKFVRKSALITSWLLIERYGSNVPGFLARYEHIPRNKYGSYPELLHQYHINLKELGGGKYLFRLKDFSFVATFENYGESLTGAGCLELPFSKDAVLIRRSGQWDLLKVFVMFGQGDKAQKLLERWNAGEGIDYGQ